MKKVIKIVLIIILVLILILAMHLIRNAIILNKIAKKQEENQDKNNYLLVAENYLSNEEGTLLYVQASNYYKDGKSLRVINNVVRNINAIFWYDADSQEQIVLYPEELKAYIENEQEIGFTYGSEGMQVDNSFWSILLSYISSEEIDGKECYRIEVAENVKYYNKENGILMKEKSGTKEKDGVEYDCISVIKDLKFGELTDNDLARPDLTQYEIIEN